MSITYTGVYSWVVDQIMLEEATTGQVVASAYIKPYDDVTNQYGVPPTAMATIDVNDIIALIAQFFEMHFAPPSNVNTLSHLQFERMDINNKIMKHIGERKKAIFQNLLQAEETIEHPEVF
tara:strand:- start:227 stop:589 length:363 start_codon:yes stop_codon:yes gene_type:complete